MGIEWRKHLYPYTIIFFYSRFLPGGVFSGNALDLFIEIIESRLAPLSQIGEGPGVRNSSIDGNRFSSVL